MRCGTMLVQKQRKALALATLAFQKPEYSDELRQARSLVELPEETRIMNDAE